MSLILTTNEKLRENQEQLQRLENMLFCTLLAIHAGLPGNIPQEAIAWYKTKKEEEEKRMQEEKRREEENRLARIKQFTRERDGLLRRLGIVEDELAKLGMSST